MVRKAESLPAEALAKAGPVAAGTSDAIRRLVQVTAYVKDSAFLKMKLVTKNIHYAIKSLLYLAGEPQQVISARELAVVLKIHRPFLRKILQILSISPFDKIRLDKLISETNLQNCEDDSQKQAKLWDF